jgi:hypothetical protein
MALVELLVPPKSQSNQWIEHDHVTIPLPPHGARVEEGTNWEIAIDPGIQA